MQVKLAVEIMFETWVEVEAKVQITSQHRAPTNKDKVDAFLLPNNKKVNYPSNPNLFRELLEVK